MTTAVTALEIDPRSAGWIGLFRRVVSPEDVARFTEMATVGVPASIELSEGRADIDLTPAGRRQPIRVHVSIRPWNEAERNRLIQVASGSVALSAALLGGDLPPAAASEFASAGLPLPPASPMEATAQCDCIVPGVCEHVAVGLLLLADLAVVRPIEMFLLRGFPSESVVEHVRQQRAITSQGVVSAHPEPRIEGARDAAAPLDDVVARFWVIPSELNPPSDEEPVRHASHALLRRMGPSPLGGRFPIVGLLASVYDEVSRRVRQEIDEADACGDAASLPVNQLASSDPPPPP